MCVEVKGKAASRGVVKGRARVVSDMTRTSVMDTLEDGDILVCNITTPEWARAFNSIKAVVSAVGGVLSHPAIVAREVGIPAVVGCGRTMFSHIKEGDTIEVDGAAGIVRVLGKGA